MEVVKKDDERLMTRLTGVKMAKPPAAVEAFAEPPTDGVRVQLTYKGELQLGTVMPHQRMPWWNPNRSVPVCLDNSGVWTHESPSDLTVIDGSSPDWSLPHKSQPPGI